MKLTAALAQVFGAGAAGLAVGTAIDSIGWSVCFAVGIVTYALGKTYATRGETITEPEATPVR